MIIFKKRFSKNQDEYREDAAYKKGGKLLIDTKVKSKIRSLGKEIIKDIGKKLLTGKFNLTKVAFPIKCSIPKTALESIIHGSYYIFKILQFFNKFVI